MTTAVTTHLLENHAGALVCTCGRRFPNASVAFAHITEANRPK